MSGLKITIPTAFVGPDVDDLPVLRDDSLLSAGSLLLMDPAHSADPWAPGVPAVGAAVPNIAWREASALIPGSTQTSLRPTVLANSMVPANRGIMERSGKGGLHGVPKQDGTAETSYTFTLPTELINYILANLTHSYYLSVWGRTTRAATQPTTTSSNQGISFFRDTTATSATGQHLSETNTLIGIAANTDSDSGGMFRSFPQTQPPRLITPDTDENPGLFSSQTTSAPPASITPATALQARPLRWVTPKASGGGLAFVMYRVYLEDLTVSGRSALVLQAMDRAAYNEQVKTDGGRYFGDTFTNPSTVV